MSQPYLVSLGPIVRDESVAVAQTFSLTGKTSAHFRTTLGGGAYNVVRHASSEGSRAWLIAMTGDDEYGAMLEVMLHRQLPGAVVCLRGMEKTRLSLVGSRRCLTERSPVTLKKLPADVAELVRGAEYTHVPPMLPGDFEFILDVLEHSKYGVLQLSAEQLADADASFALAKRARLIMVNRQELQLWVGRENPDDGISRLLEGHGIENVIVTGADGVTAALHGRHYHEPCPPANRLVQTVGAGDCLLGTMLARKLAGDSDLIALKAGIAAAHRHVVGTDATTRALPADRPAQHIPIGSRWRVAGLRWAGSAAAVAASVAAGLGLGLLF